MKSFILIIGVLIALTGLWFGRSSLVETQQRTIQARSIEGEMNALKKKIDELGHLPQRPGVPLAFIYARVINDMNMLAGSHRVACVIDVKKAQGEDVEKIACPSSLEGVREIEMEIIFSGLKRRGILLSLMDSVSKVEAAWPVVIWRVLYEKDSLTIALAVVGI